MSPSTTFTSIFKLGRNVSKAITKVPRAFKNVRTSSKQQSKAVLPAMSSIYEISHLVDPFQPIPIKKEDDNEELNSLASTSLTTTTVDSELSTSLPGSELEDESDSDSDRTMSDDDIKLANIKIFGTENGSVARVEAVSVSDDGEDDDTIEEERAMATSSITPVTKTSSLLSVTLEPIEEEDEDAADDEALTVDEDATADNDGWGCDGSIQRARAMYQDLQTIRASLSRSSDDDTKTLSFGFTPSVNSTPVHRDAVAEREEARSRASALSIARLQEDSPICFMDGIPMHTRPAVLSLLGRSSPLRNCYVEDADEDDESAGEEEEEEVKEEPKSMSPASWADMEDDEELEPLEDLVAWNATSR